MNYIIEFVDQISDSEKSKMVKGLMDYENTRKCSASLPVTCCKIKQEEDEEDR